ncbi:MAG: hypothetical protein HRT57_02720 [Crocinitomicaceae bacterium]|nr:hypothetical protein [Crocinitomicaceae bacterium]
MELKVPEEELEEHLQKIRYVNPVDEPRRKSKEDKSDDDQRTLKATDSDLNAIANRNKNWRDKSGDRPGRNIKQASIQVTRKGNTFEDQTLELGALQPHGSRCSYQRKTGQGKKAKLPEPDECAYCQSCDYRYWGRFCQSKGQSTFAKDHIASQRTIE